jgi:hypothetical protein
VSTGSGVPTDLTKISKATEEKIDEASKVRIDSFSLFFPPISFPFHLFIGYWWLTRVVQVWSDFLGESERGGQQSDILERTLRYMVMCDYTPLSLAAGNLLVRQFRCAPPLGRKPIALWVMCM